MFHFIIYRCNLVQNFNICDWSNAFVNGNDLKVFYFPEYLYHLTLYGWLKTSITRLHETCSSAQEKVHPWILWLLSGVQLVFSSPDNSTYNIFSSFSVTCDSTVKDASVNAQANASQLECSSSNGRADSPPLFNQQCFQYNLSH